jgi:uncharacterized protein
VSDPHSPLRLNVGFIAHQNIGYSRDFHFDLPHIFLPPDLNLTQLSGTCHIARTPQGLLVQMEMVAIFDMDCVRCLEPCSQNLHIHFTELYAFSKRHITESGLLFPEDGQIDLGPLVREDMLLDIPINPVCRPDCKGLCPICGENRNLSLCTHEDVSADPRLGELKNMLS